MHLLQRANFHVFDKRVKNPRLLLRQRVKCHLREGRGNKVNRAQVLLSHPRQVVCFPRRCARHYQVQDIYAPVDAP